MAQEECRRSRYLNLTPYGHFNDSKGRPALKPLCGELNAINLNTGEYAWKIPVGNHPELQRKDELETGTEGSGGPIVQQVALYFSAAHATKFRAFDKHNGNLLWETTLPGIANAIPCTYMADGKQFVACLFPVTEKIRRDTLLRFRFLGIKSLKFEV